MSIVSYNKEYKSEVRLSERQMYYMGETMK